MWEKAGREVGIAERREVEGGIRVAVVFDCVQSG